MLADFSRLTAVFVLVFLALHIPAFSQRDVTVIKLPEDSNGEHPFAAFPVSGIRVVQVLPDSTYLGFAQKGMANRVVKAVPEASMTACLQTFFDGRYRSAYTAQGKTLLLVVKELRINERTFAMKEKAYTRLQAETWLSNDGSLFYKATDFDTVLMRGGMDVTASHGKSIAKAFHLLLADLVSRVQQMPKDTMALLAAADITAQAVDRFNQPILTSITSDNGLWMSYEEFLQNKPSVTSYEVNVNKKKEVSFFEKRTDGTLEALKPWGLCKEGEWYKCDDGVLVPIEKEGNSIVVSGSFEGRVKRNKQQFTNALIGGIAGGIVGGVITTSISAGQTVFFYVPYYPRQEGAVLYTRIAGMEKNQPEASVVDLKSGNLFF
ncbi:hypothetical protein LL912_23635 [Niabella sp. CC-SYL272]|uniref:hypothetical protein n=1 Tax=Niabella agricola TaxID=2891571 RepID=UPI001F34CBB4|nr:hypothetical protein [Niabella agricola]MCF3111800.1 hypothetical protein [Niabella agricola]